jgi:hypothetical protein
VGHTGGVEIKLPVSAKVWEIAPITVIAIGRAIRAIVMAGIGNWRWWEEIWLVLGWMVGWLLAEIDDVLYVAMGNPQELTSQRVKKELTAGNFIGAWNLLQATRGERTSRMPVRNALTLLVMAIIGVWIVTSNGSPLGSGVVLGLSTRLLTEFLAEKDKNKWFWIFSREFSRNEQIAIAVGCTLALIWQAILTVRG